MKLKHLLFLTLLALFITPSAQAEEMTENFDGVSIVDANGTAVTGYTAGVGLSNGWKVVDGKMYLVTDYAAHTYSLWNTANSGTQSLCSNYGTSNNAFIVLPQLISGKLTFYYRRTKTSTSSSYKGKFSIYEVEQSGDTYTYKRVIRTESYTTAMNSFVKYEIDLGEEPMYIAFNLALMAIDDVTYNTVSLEPHEHDYASEWSSDENEHWHECTSTVGICDAKKIDVAAHDGLTCSVCGYKVPGIEAFPWTEDFNSISSGIPAGWDNSEGTTTTESYKWNYYLKSVRFDSYNNRSGITNILATPLLYIPSEGAYELRFKVKNPKGGNYEVKIGEYGSAERTTLFDNLTNIADWTEKSVSLASYAGKAVKVYFCGTSNWGSGDAYLYLDDVTVKERITHVHNYSEEWSHDYNNHWHACTSEVGDCDAPQSDFAPHSFNAEGICTVCGYDQPYMEDFENGIPASWTNNGWTIENNPTNGNGTKMAYAGRYAAGNTLITPLLQAKAGDEMSVEALLPWNDETLIMEYSVDNGETWDEAFRKTPAANNTLTTISWTSPVDGKYLLRFSGRYNYIDNFCGFKLAPIEISESDITLTYNWATLCYPADVTIAGGVEAYTVSGVEDNVLVLEKITSDAIAAGTPVILHSETSATQTLPAATMPYYLKDEPKTVAGNLLVGTYGAMTLSDSKQYVMQNLNDKVAFYQVAPAHPFTTVAFRCYLQLADGNQAARILITEEDITTAISAITTAEDGTVYDLSGRKVKTLSKGTVYVVNGKKIMIK